MNGDGSSLNDWTDTIGKLGGTASGILGALRKPNTPAPAPAAKSGSTPWGMIAAIGAGVVLLLVVVMSMGSRK
jgi:hypothetical protein